MQLSDNLLGIEIIPIQNCSIEEATDLVKRHEICYQAKLQLLSLKISWQDYLDLIECAGVDIQEYLSTANDNALVLGF